MKNWIKELDRTQFGSGTYSQSYQDELLDIIFSNIGTTNPTPFCVEFGFNSTSLTSGTGANVANLVLNHNWDSLLLDGANENLEINLHKHFLLPSNIAEIFRQYGVPQQPELISVDVDSLDLWLFEALLKEYQAMVFSVEYNCHYPLNAAITFPNDSDERWVEDRGYGASLKALNMVATRHGYSLLWVVPWLDAFFIRNDLIDDGAGENCFPFSKWKHCTELMGHLPIKDSDRLKIFVDYEVFLDTDGDIEKSKQSAYPICKKYLSDSFTTRVLLQKQSLFSLLGWPRRMVRKLLA